jgi:cytochrome c oxidase assembly factor CtaG
MSCSQRDTRQSPVLPYWEAIEMSDMRRAVKTTGRIAVGVLAGIGLYILCVLIMFLLGGLFYSVTLGALLAGVVSLVIAAYLGVRKRETTSWPVVGGLVAFSLVWAVLAILDSPSTAFMWFR